MSRAIYKYEIPIDDQWHEFTMPLQARVVHIGAQQADAVCAWAEVATGGDEIVKRSFRIFGTGHPIPSGAVHQGSVISGAFVWHAYARTAK